MSNPITNTSMFHVRNLLLCHPRNIEDYMEEQDGTTTVVYNNNVVVTAIPTHDDEFHLIITSQKPFRQDHKLFNDVVNLATAMFTIHKYITATAEDNLFNIFRNVVNG